MSKDPFADLGFEPAVQANTDPFASLGFQEEQAPEPGFVQSTVQSVTKPFLATISQGRDVVQSVKDLGTGIKQAVKGEQVVIPERPNQTQYDYGYLGKVKSFGKATADKEGGKALLRAAGAGVGMASNIPMAKSVGTAAQLLKAGTLRKVLGSMTGKLAVEGAAGGGMYGLGDSLIEGDSAADTLKNTVINAGIGAVAAPVIGKGAEYAGRGLGKAIQMSTKEGRDASVIAARERDIFDIENNYSKTRKAIDQSKDANAASRSRVAHTDVLVDSVDNTGTIRTTQKGGAVEKYRKDFVDGNESVVRDLLVKEGRMIDLPTVRKELTKEIRNSGLEEDALVAALNKVNKKLAGLTLRGKNGMIPLEAIQDAKLFTYKNIDYTKPTSKLEAKAVARAYKGLIEKNSSHDIRSINKELQKYYQDLDLLENLDGKKVEGGRLGKHFAQVAGNVVGAAVGSVGGPVGAGIGGLVGGAVSKKIAGKVMSNTFGRAVGKAIPKSEVLEKAVSAAKTPRLALPAPKSAIRSETRGTKAISLPSRSQTRMEAEQVAKFGKKYEKTVVLDKKQLALPAPKPGSPKSSNNVPIKIKPTDQKDISRGFPKNQRKNESMTRDSSEVAKKSTTKNTPTPSTPVQKSNEAVAKKRIVPKSMKNSASDTTQNKAFVKKDLTRSIPGSVPQKGAKVQLPKTNEDFTRKYLAGTLSEEDKKAWKDLNSKQKDEIITIYRGQNSPVFDLKTPASVHNMKGKSFTVHKDQAEMYTLSGTGLKGGKADPTIIVGTIPKSKILTMSDLGKNPKAAALLKDVKNQISKMTEDDLAEGSLPENVMDLLVPVARILGKDGVDMKSFGMVDEIRILNDATSFKQTNKPTTGYHIVRDENNIKKILKDGFSLKGFGKESGSADVGDPKGAYFFPSKSAYKALEGWEEYPSENLLKADLHISNPYKVKSAEDYFENVVKPATKTTAENLDDFRGLNKKGDSEKITKFLQDMGHDGIVDKKGLISYDEPQIVVFDTSKIKNIAQNFAAAMGIPMTMSGLPQSKNENQTKLPNQSREIKIEGRKAALSEADLKELGAVLYGEIGNRKGDRQEFEAQVITNIILNRMESGDSTYKGKNASQLLAAKNEFQAYGGKRYQEFKNGTATETEKVAKINKFLDDLRAGKLPNKIDKALFYGHAKDDTIRVFDTWEEYKKNLHKIK